MKLLLKRKLLIIAGLLVVTSAFLMVSFLHNTPPKQTFVNSASQTNLNSNNLQHLHIQVPDTSAFAQTYIVGSNLQVSNN